MNRASIHQRNTKSTTCDLNYSVMHRQYRVPHEYFTMHELNIMCFAVNGKMKWQQTEEILFTQFEYYLIVSYS